MFRYLKEEGYYSELYDLGTIERCLSIEGLKYQIKKGSEIDKNKDVSMVKGLQLYFIKGERYKNKRATIAEWMDMGRKRDERMDNVKEPEDNMCPVCFKNMKVFGKELEL